MFAMGGLSLCVVGIPVYLVVEVFHGGLLILWIIFTLYIRQPGHHSGLALPLRSMEESSGRGRLGAGRHHRRRAPFPGNRDLPVVNVYTVPSMGPSRRQEGRRRNNANRQEYENAVF